jgi:hypothetical protein
MRVKRWPLVLAAWTVLFAGLTNAHAHVHLCFHGQGLPAAAHVLDDGHQAHEHTEHAGGHEDHDDLDVDVPHPALAKSIKYDDLVAMFWSPGSAVLPPAPAACASTPYTGAVPYSPRLYARPPLRAPPA